MHAHAKGTTNTEAHGSLIGAHQAVEAMKLECDVLPQEDRREFAELLKRGSIS